MSNIGFNVNIDTQLSKLSRHLLNTDKTNVRSDLNNIDHSYQKAIVKEREEEFNKWHEEKTRNDITIKKVNDLTLNQLYANFINTFVNIVDDIIRLLSKTNQDANEFVSKKEDFYSSAWNFGTRPHSVTSVREIVGFMTKYWKQGKTTMGKNKKKFYEHKNLQLDIRKAKKFLNWWPTYSIEKSVKITTDWYLKVKENKMNAFSVSKSQIENYMKENDKN